MSARAKATRTNKLYTPREGDLDKAEKNRLYRLGYKNLDIDQMSTAQARGLIQSGVKNPGSSAMLADSPLPSHLADEEVEVRTKSAPVQEAYVITDEFTNRCVKGDDPLDATLNAYADANPGMRIRLVNPELPPSPGPQFQPITGADKVGGLVPSFMPESLYQEHYVRQNHAKSDQMLGAVTTPRGVGDDAEDLTEGLNVGGRVLKPRLVQEKSQPFGSGQTYNPKFVQPAEPVDTNPFPAP